MSQIELKLTGAKAIIAIIAASDLKFWLRGDYNEVRYFRMEYSQLTKCRLKRETTKWSYYLNLF